jgi:hypothetical protein
LEKYLASPPLKRSLRVLQENNCHKFVTIVFLQAGMGSLQHKQPTLVHKQMQLSLNCHKPEPQNSLGFQVCLSVKPIVTELSQELSYSKCSIFANTGIFKNFSVEAKT